MKNHVVCRSFISKGFGLMFRRKPDYAMVFEFSNERRIALTMWFVFFPIDVVWIDNKLNVVEIKKNFKPFTNYVPKNASKYVIEFPVGYLGNTKLGDKIFWE